MQDLDELLETSNEIYNTIQDPNKNTLLIDAHFFLSAIATDTNQHKVSREHKHISYKMQFEIDERTILSVVELAVARIQDGEYQEAVTMLLGAQNARIKLAMSRALACPIIEGGILRTKEGNTDLAAYLPSELEAYLGFAYTMLDRLIEGEVVLTKALLLQRQILGKPDDRFYR